MRVFVNGQPHDVDRSTSVLGLLKILNLENTLVAVECNHEIVPRAQHAEALLNENDQIEIVHFVGGG